MQYEETLFYHFNNYPLLLERFLYNKYYYFTNINYNDINEMAQNLYSKKETANILDIFKNYIIDKLTDKYTTVVQLDIFGKGHNREIPSKEIIRKLMIEYLFYFDGADIDITALYNLFRIVYNIKVMTRQEIRQLVDDIEEITVLDNLYYLKSIEKKTDKISDDFYHQNIEESIKNIHKDNLSFVYKGNVISEIIKTKNNENIFLFYLLKTSLLDLCKKTYSKMLYQNPNKPKEKEKRNIDIILRRKKGMTLAQIGGVHRLAKERIRQIIQEYIDKFESICKKSNNFMLRIIKGFSHNQFLVLRSDIEKIIGENTEIFMYLLEKISVMELTYLPDIDGYIFNGENWIIIVDNMLDAASDSLTIDEGEKLIKDILFELKKNNIDIYYSPIQKKFHKIYTLKGSIYNKISLTQSGKYSIVMKMFFDKGFSIHNEEKMLLFRQKYEETFNESLENKTTRSIEGRIEDTCILVDRGTYIAYDNQKLTLLLAEKIESYIDVSINKTFAFNSLFLIFQEDLKKEDILNRYYFQALLRKSVTKKYFFSRDYISKQKDSNFIDEIQTVIFNNDGKINLKIINKELPGVTQIMFVAAMDKLNMISLFNGEYISLSKIKISDIEFQKIADVIDIKTTNNEIMNAKDFYGYIYDELPDLFINNDINPYILYGIAKSCFRDKFQFKRPFIARNDVFIGDRKTRIMAFLSDYRLINISDLRIFMLENDLVIPDMLRFIETLDGFIRNDENSLISERLLSVDEYSVKDIERHLFSYEEKTIIKRIDCSNFPTIGVSWNYWLLASILTKKGIKYGVVVTNNSYKAPGYILKKR